MSLPPLSLGGFHDNVTLDEVISSYSSGASGGPGRSRQKLINNSFLKNLNTVLSYY